MQALQGDHSDGMQSIATGGQFLTCTSGGQSRPPPLGWTTTVGVRLCRPFWHSLQSDHADTTQSVPPPQWKATVWGGRQLLLISAVTEKCRLSLPVRLTTMVSPLTLTTCRSVFGPVTDTSSLRHV